jgi:hypothetical protein
MQQIEQIGRINGLQGVEHIPLLSGTLVVGILGLASLEDRRNLFSREFVPRSSSRRSRLLCTSDCCAISPGLGKRRIGVNERLNCVGKGMRRNRLRSKICSPGSRTCSALKNPKFLARVCYSIFFFNLNKQGNQRRRKRKISDKNLVLSHSKAIKTLQERATESSLRSTATHCRSRPGYETENKERVILSICAHARAGIPEFQPNICYSTVSMETDDGG